MLVFQNQVRNPIIEEIKGQKKQLILLNKVDLADPSQTKTLE